MTHITHDGSRSSRRRFIKLAATTVATIPLINLAACSESSSGPADAKAAPPAPAPVAKPTPTPMPTPPPAADAAPPTPPAELPRLSETDPTASALGYHHDASKVDNAKYPRHAGPEGAKQYCHNCSLLLGREDQEWVGCSLFPGKAVNRNGWCNGWSPKPQAATG